MSKNIFFFTFLLVVLLSCGDNKNYESRPSGSNPNESKKKFPLEIKYASKFKVEEQHGYNVVTVLNPWQGASQNYVYVLGSETQKVPELKQFRQNKNDIIQFVNTPIKSIVLTSTTFIPLLDQLKESETLKGFPGTDHISSEKVRKLIDEGKIKNLGTESHVNIERLIDLNPDALMDYAMQGENKSATLARNAGISVLYNADYLEKTPLGRAEWIKFAGLFLNKVEKADSIFNALENNYDSLKRLSSTASYKPTVYCGIMYGDIWFTPGGKNSSAQFLKDAQADYLWKDTPEEGSIKLSFEAVYEKAHNADFWIGTASFNTLQEIKNADDRYSHFQAFKEGNVYTYNAKTGAKGGLTFFELGYARPDLILADLIKILHPELLPQYDLYFYQKLK